MQVMDAQRMGVSGVLLFVQQLPEDWKQEQEEYCNDILNPLGQINEFLQSVGSVHIADPRVV